MQVVAGAGGEVALYSAGQDEAAFLLHATARATALQPMAASEALSAIQARCAGEVEAASIYARFEELGLDYGPSFRGLEGLWLGDGEALARLRPDREEGYGIAPAVLDAALQAVLVLRGGDQLLLPFEMGALTVSREGAAAWVHVRDDGGSTELTILDDSGRELAEVSGLRVLPAGREKLEADGLYRFEWREQPKTAAAAGRWLLLGLPGLEGEHATEDGLEQALLASEGAGLVCFWPRIASETVPAHARRVALAALAVVQTLIKLGGPCKLRLVLTAEEALASSTLKGLGRTVRQEHPELDCRLIETDDLACVARELQGDDLETEVAWRGGKRYVARLKRAAPVAPVAAKLDGTVLVTGGLGALGLHVASWLADRKVPRLVLASRRGLETPGAAEAVAALEARGVAVTVAAVDAADRPALAALLHQIPDLRGVVHTAGVVDDGVLAELDGPRLTRVLSPKVDGAFNLHELTASRDLEIFVLFSSVSGLLGAAGQGNYAAANTFLDALAAHRRESGLAGQSLAFGPWAGAGMAARLGDLQRSRLERRGLLEWSAAEAMDRFGAALGRSDAQLGLIRFDLPAVGRAFAGEAPALWSELIRPQREKQAGGSWASRLLEVSEADRGAEVRAAVSAEVARVLSWQGLLPEDRAFSELGLDSLMAVELRNELGRRLGVSLPATLAFDHPTVASLSEWLLADVLRADEQPAKAKARAALKESNEPIAIVGFGCRYPGGVQDGESYWKLLASGADAVGKVPRSRWDADALYDPDPDAAGKSTTKEGGFVEGIEEFDAAFFGISPREAVAVDPQQRLLLETSWEALEHAGWNPERLLGGDTGVFVGLMYQEYAGFSSGQAASDGYVMTGSLGSVASGRLSYVLGLKGPSLTVDTACSSSLVTVHLACQALRRGECSTALAGGVTLMLTPNVFVEFSRLRGLSPDGRSKSFAAGADGVGWSEGCGMLALKRLSDAKRDGDRVLAVIRGTAVNHDGRSNGLTAPNGPSQEAVIEQALNDAGVAPREVSYVECHGTGTKLGDPIEVQALGKALGDRKAPVVIGSVKSNFGHTQAAAGVAGIIKVVLAMQHEEIPKTLHFHQPSPHIAWSELPVRVAGEAISWPRGSEPRIAGVSSFGISGTNAHVVLQEPPVQIAAAPALAEEAQLFVISAKTPEALAAQSRRLVETALENPRDLAFSLATTRAAMEERLAIVARGGEELRAELQAGRPARTAAAKAPRVAFLFSGQGSQRPGMGRELYQRFEPFRAALDRAVALLDPHLERPLKQVMWAARGTEEAALLDQTGFTQPALFAVQYALCAQWKAWGVEPRLVAGHSIGEIAAACVAGVLSLEDAAKLVAARAKLMQSLPAGGAMAQVSASEADVRPWLPPGVEIAAVNSPSRVVVAGPKSLLAAACAQWRERGVKCRELQVSHAFHSAQMDGMLEAFAEVAGGLRYGEPRLQLVSALSGEPGSAAHWVRHVREPVRFADCVQALREAGAGLFIEIGPQANLLGFVPEEDAVLVPSLRAGREETASLLEGLGDYWTAGGAVDWAALFGPARRVELPSYPWQRQRHWVDGAHLKPIGGAPTGHPLLGDRLAAAGQRAVFETTLSLASHPWLGDHRVAGRLVVPGAALAEMSRAAAAQALGGPAAVRDLLLQAPLILPDDGAARRVQAVVGTDGEVTLYSQGPASAAGEAWLVHATSAATAASPVAETQDLDALRSRCSEELDAPGIYEALFALGLEYGPGFRGLRKLWRGEGELLAELLPSRLTGYRLQPAQLDAALQAVLILDGASELRLPFEIGSLQLFQDLPAAFVRARVREGELTASLLGVSGQVVAELRGVRLRAADRTLFAAERDGLYRLEWQERPAQAGEPRPLLIVANAGSAWARSLSRHGTLATVESLAVAPPAEAVVCLWEAAEGETPDETAFRIAREGLQIAQQLASRQRTTRLFWVTRGATSAAGEPMADLATATILGLGRTVQREHPELHCRLVDAPDEQDLLRELQSVDDEDEVAWRNGRRLVARLVRAKPAEKPARPALRGSVLISGGLGALGLIVARELAKRGAPHLILTGRRGMQTPGAAEAVAELQALTRVTVAEVDVADEEALARTLASVPDLSGVVHAAGILDDGVLAEQRPERFDRVLAPKVRGAWNLHRLTKDLDFFVLFSSISGALGAAGQGNYAAANSFLDALAAHRLDLGLPAQSLGWGPWDEGGMAAGLAQAQRARLERQGMSAWSASEGAALFDELLGRGEAHLGVVRFELGAVGRAFAGSPPPVWRELIRPQPKKQADGGWVAQLLELPESQRDAFVRAAVSADVARVLSWQGALPEDRPFSELGLDSLMAVELRNELGRRVGVSLPATLAFDHPTVNALGEWLSHSVLQQRSPVTPRVDAAKETNEPIAIVGFGCRYPGGVHDGESFWKLLAGGTDAVDEVPRGRWDAAALYDPDPDAVGKSTSKSGGFLHGIERFDAGFFGISPREAVTVDPQQRLLLETSWEALEHAGWNPDRLAGGDTGVFVGLMYQEYAGLSAELDGYVMTGSLGSVASGRLSYVLGLKGPSLTVDTACSSSLVTVHLACQALRRGECSTALAGGVTLMLTPKTFVEFSRLRGLAPDGRCKSFGAGADGVGWSEGCGMLALKRLSDAKRDGDRVLAVIRGSAVNHDGRSNGLTAPSGPAQELVIEQALRDAGVAPREVSYVECHGTGTKLGDPIEVQALGAALGKERTSPVVIGSVKSNLGHTQAAAGVAGIIKVVLAMQEGKIPQSLHAAEPSPHIAWSELPVTVATAEIAWPAGPEGRIAGVSSFGISGTNAHVILQDAAQESAAEPAAAAGAAQLFVISAKSEAALLEQCERLADAAAADPADLAVSLATTRAAMDLRVSIVARTSEELRAALEAAASGETPAGASRGMRAVPKKIVFVFPGQGSQWAGMGRQLLAEEPVFRAAFTACDAAIRAETGWSPLEELEGARLDRVDIVQPVLFAFEVALAALWRSWGVEPDAVIGHSMGEIAAAHVASALSLEDAVAVICRRSALLRRISGQGEMAVVELSLAEAQAALAGYEERLAVAVSNSPRQTVISGEPSALGGLLRGLESKGIFCRRVRVDVASHSPQVDPLRGELLTALASVRPAPPRISMRSTVLDADAKGTALDAAYWWNNLRQPVRFASSMQALMASGHGVFIEMSPHPILTNPVEEVAAGNDSLSVGSLRREQDERGALLESLGALWVRGHAVAWDKVLPPLRKRVPLPGYAWQRETYWPEAIVAQPAAFGHPLLGESRGFSTMPGMRSWDATVSQKRFPWLADHAVHGSALFPAAGYLEMALAAGEEALGKSAFEVAQVQLLEPLRLGAETKLQLVTAESAGGHQLQIASQTPSGSWRVHARGVLRRTSGDEPRFDLGALRARLGSDAISGEAAYVALASVGLDYGPAFQGLTELWRGDGEALGRIHLPKTAGPQVAYRLHPALLDSGFHVALTGLFGIGQAETAAWVPVELESLQLFAKPAGELWCYAQDVEVTPQRRSLRLLLIRDDGTVVVRLEGLAAQRLADEVPAADSWFLETAWQIAKRSRPARGEGRFLLVGEGQGVAAALARALTNAGHRVECAANVPLAVFGADGPTAVVHLGSLEAGGDLDSVSVETATVLGCDSVLETVQALAAAPWPEAPRLWLVTRGAQAAGGGDVSVAQAPLLGLARVIALEHPDLRCTRIDLDREQQPREIAALAAELLARDDEEEIALRGEERFVARLRRRTPAFEQPPVLRPDATYLVTGGLGGLGLSVAGWLVDRGARHLLLLGRTGANSPAQLAALRAMEARGARATIATADVADKAALAEILRQADPPLRGVIHAAGVLDDGLLMRQTPARLRKVMAPKILGALHLHDLTRHLPLDFFVLYGSGAGLLGSPGQGNYAAANTFLDALAHHRRAQGLPALSIDWGAFSEVGLAAARDDRAARLEARGLRSLSPDEGLRALSRLWHGDAAQMAVLPLDARQWVDFYPAAARPRLSELLAGKGSSDSSELAKRLSVATPSERAELVESAIRVEVARVLRIPEASIEADVPFLDLGMDSLRGLELRNRVGEVLGLRFPAILFFKYPSLRAVTGFALDALLRARLEYEATQIPEAPLAIGEPEVEEGRL
ncbi:MAG TPA: SDR family NAD(P)-dependent oxidoreductase [Myxococcales bacterium]|nr:SDR family NAD(P)-dependent oxidoreductase [Myxococcales bacterium]